MQIRYSTAACALIIVILGLLTLAFSTNAKRALYVMQSPSSVNVALSLNGTRAKKHQFGKLITVQIGPSILQFTQRRLRLNEPDLRWSTHQ